jgi:5-methyltetrahydrofolate--homocysteine methyltransferase
MDNGEEHNNIKNAVNKKILILDGAMGTMLQREKFSEEDFRGTEYKDHPVDLKGFNGVLNVTQPGTVKKIHKEYLEAGADIVTTNSFNANYYGLSEFSLEDEVYKLNFAAAKIAKEAVSEFCEENKNNHRFVAGTLGPTSKTASISPDINQPAKRDVAFDDLADVYKAQAKALIDGGVELLLVETVFDTLNAKAALFAINELKEELNKDIPVMVSATIDESGRNLSGQTVEAFFNSLEPFGLFSIGLNCSFGADQMVPYLERLAIKSTVNVSAHPNAGLPNEFGNYDQSAIEMTQQLGKYLENGLVNIVGGCCGTTPEHVKAIKRLSEKYNPRVIMPHIRTTRLSGLQSLGVKDTTRLIQIGERTTVTGSKVFNRLIKNEQYEDAVGVARQQVDAGADLLNISMDDGMIDAKTAMPYFLKLISAEPDIASVPFMIDSSNFDVIVSSLKTLQGRAIVNSISLKDGLEVFKEQARKIHELGANVVVMAFDEKGQAESFERKIEICSRVYEIWTNELKYSPEYLIFDPNVLTIGTGIEEHNHYGKDFIKAVQWIKQNLPYAKVSAGITNVSFAFRGNDYLREVINSVFLYHCQNAGLDFAIVNPGKIYKFSEIPEKLKRYVEDLVFNLRKDATERLLEVARKYSKKGKTETVGLKWRREPASKRLAYALENGITQYIKQDVNELSEKYNNPLDIIEGPLMKGMDKVGKRFSKGEMFLPQVIKSARVMNEAVAALMPGLQEQQKNRGEEFRKNKVLLATVNGDVHDIGKNILSLVLQSNNFDIIDMGVMVPKEDIIDKVKSEQPSLIALSGLITPSLDNMIEVIEELEKEKIDTPVMVGGASTSSLHTAVKIAPRYSGVVAQSNDASRGVAVASKLISDNAADYIKELQEEQLRLQKEYEGRKKGKRRISFRDARRKRFSYNYREETPVEPRMLGTKYFDDFDLKLLRKYIDWTPFFHGWGLKGVFPQIFEKEKVGKEAKRVFDEAQNMLDKIVNEKLIRPKGAIGLFPANSDADDVLVFEDDERRKIIKRIPMLRQQQMRDKKGYALSLSDYIAPVDSGIKDYFGGFAVTTGLGTDEHVERFKSEGDSYNSIMFRLIADRLVEAFAEVLHEWVRKKYWGYDPDEDLSKEELIKEKYQGIRPAPGYPACPDHSLKGPLFDLLDVENKVGITLTDSYAMKPASSVTGFYMAHNASKYFGIGKIGKDQLKDYARRTKMDVREAEKWLNAVLDE